MRRTGDDHGGLGFQTQAKRSLEGFRVHPSGRLTTKDLPFTDLREARHGGEPAHRPQTGLQGRNPPVLNPAPKDGRSPQLGSQGPSTTRPIAEEYRHAADKPGPEHRAVLARPLRKKPGPRGRPAR